MSALQGRPSRRTRSSMQRLSSAASRPRLTSVSEALELLAAAAAYQRGYRARIEVDRCGGTTVDARGHPLPCHPGERQSAAPSSISRCRPWSCSKTGTAPPAARLAPGRRQRTVLLLLKRSSGAPIRETPAPPLAPVDTYCCRRSGQASQIDARRRGAVSAYCPRPLLTENSAPPAPRS